MSYTSCHLYLFYKHHTLSVNCIATTTDFTPDTFNTSYGWWNQGLGWRPRKTSPMGLYNWGFLFFLIKYWNNKYMEESEIWFITVLLTCCIGSLTLASTEPRERTTSPDRITQWPGHQHPQTSSCFSVFCATNFCSQKICDREKPKQAMQALQKDGSE